jgi:SAM-dependent methyltransferase
MSECAKNVTSDGWWNSEQCDYWSTLTSLYDGLYQSRWSELENDWVSQKLRFLKTFSSPRILDLGCGTGLGAVLSSRWAPLTNYVGVDISPTMAQRTAANFGVETHTGAMDNLAWASDESFDAVICLFSAASFVHDPLRLFEEISRVLRPGGMAYVSTLGRAWGNSPREVRFRTRGHSDSTSVPAWRFRAADLREIANRHGLRPVSIEHMNSLSGICESPRLWQLGRLLARTMPASSHLIEITCTKPRRELV